MDKDELLDKILEAAKRLEGVSGGDRIAGENVIGIETDDGKEYFLELTEA